MTTFAIGIAIGLALPLLAERFGVWLAGYTAKTARALYEAERSG